jgi:hypothetical protein
MAPILDRHPIRVAVDGDKDEAGLMVFADGVLVAVFSYLKNTVDEDDLRDHWYLEAGFGPCGGVIPAPILRSQEEAERWVLYRCRTNR